MTHVWINFLWTSRWLRLNSMSGWAFWLFNRLSTRSYFIKFSNSVLRQPLVGQTIQLLKVTYIYFLGQSNEKLNCLIQKQCIFRIQALLENIISVTNLIFFVKQLSKFIDVRIGCQELIPSQKLGIISSFKSIFTCDLEKFMIVFQETLNCWKRYLENVLHC